MSKNVQAEYRAKLCLSFVEAPPFFERSSKIDEPQRSTFLNSVRVVFEIHSLGAVGEAGPRGLRVAAQIWALNQIYAYIFFVCATNPRPPTILETKRKEDVSK